VRAAAVTTNICLKVFPLGAGHGLAGFIHRSCPSSSGSGQPVGGVELVVSPIILLRQTHFTIR
jgi:hypothetical protein